MAPRCEATSPAYAKDSQADAQKLLTGIFNNVTVMDKSANDSHQELRGGQRRRRHHVRVRRSWRRRPPVCPTRWSIPPSTVAIQNPVAVVDKNAETHCVEDIANAFVEFLHTPDAAAIYRLGRLRASRPTSRRRRPARAPRARSTPIKDLFTTDDLGGWDALLNDTVFGPNGAFTHGAAGRRRDNDVERRDAERTTTRAGRIGRGVDPRVSRARRGRWGLRGIALLYLGPDDRACPSPPSSQRGFSRRARRRCATRSRPPAPWTAIR